MLKSFLLSMVIIITMNIVGAEGSPPVTTIELSGTDGNNGWNISDVTVTFTVTDNSGTGINYTKYRTDNGVWIDYLGYFIISDEGIFNIEYFSEDNEGNIEDIKTTQIKIDKTSPTTIVGLAGTEGNNGWNQSDVFVNLIAADNEAGVENITYIIDDTTQIYSVPFIISNEGIFDIEYYSEDNAGNTESVNILQIKIDKTLPNIIGTLLTSPNINNWFNTDVTIDFTGSDDISGIFDITPDITISTEGTDLSATGTAIDNAGWSNTTTVGGINIDKIIPIIDISGVVDEEYYNENINIIIDISDTLSTIDIQEITLNDVPYISGTEISEEGIYQLIATATDKAGNTAYETINFTIDKTSPIIDISGVVEEEIYGSSITPTFNCIDNNLKTCTATLDSNFNFESGTEISTNGEHILTVFAEDLASNNLSSTINFTIDQNFPTITVSGVIDGQYYNTDIIPLFECMDTDLASCTATLNETNFISGTEISEEGTYQLNITAIDSLGHGTYEKIYFVIDKTSPIVNIDGVIDGQYYATSITPTISFFDIFIDIETITLNGNIYISGTTISDEGIYQLTASATDRAGNSNIKIINFSIDKNPPETTATLSGYEGNNSWYRSDVQVTLIATDSISGVTNTTYIINGIDQTYSEPFTISNEGIFNIEYYSTDNASNIEDINNIQIKIDKTRPSIIAPDDIITEATGYLTNVNLGTPVVGDNIDTDLTIIDDAPPSGFPVGQNIVNWTVEDDAGNNFTDIQIINITDNSPPSIQAPADKSIKARGGNSWGAYLKYGSNMQPELDKFTNLLGVYAAHTHASTNQIFLDTYGHRVRHTTINSLINSSIASNNITFSEDVGYTIIDGDNLTYKLVKYNVSEGIYPKEGQLSFITVGDPHIETDDYQAIENLRQVANFINKSDVDFAVFLGDVVDAGSKDEYKIVKDILNTLNKPYYVPPGAHDIRSGIVIDYANNLGNWKSSDPINTNISTEKILKQEGDGSLKITINDNSKNDTIIADILPKDLTDAGDSSEDHEYIEFWIRSTIAGVDIIKAGFGEQTFTENEFPITINESNRWQKVRLYFPYLSMDKKDSITKFGFTIVGNYTGDIYIDNIVTARNLYFEKYIGNRSRIENINGYQLLFIDVWKEHLLVQPNQYWNKYAFDFVEKDNIYDLDAAETPDKQYIHWDFDYDNPLLNKSKPTLVFIHGPLKSNFSSINLGTHIVSDNADPNPIVTNSADYILPTGKNVVIWTAKDSSGNIVTDIQNVTIVDDRPPNIDIPANVTKEATGILTGLDVGIARVSDLVDTNPIIINDAPLEFPVGTTKVTWNATDYTGNKVTGYQHITIKDTTPPIITLIGNNPEIVDIGSTYIDAGATAIDIVDGDISSNILIDNPIDTSTPGIYLITYNVTDSSGNKATENRTVFVGENIPPVTIISISGTLGDLGWYLSNVEVTLIATDDSGIANTSYRINGGSWIDYISPFTISTEGSNNIEYYSIDNIGNTETIKNQTANIDKTPPTSISSINNRTYAPTYINWTWTDSKSSDFSKVMVYIGGTFKTNVSKGTKYYNATGLNPGKSYKISTHTVDIHGNVNNTWRNNTAKTAKAEDLPPASITNLINKTTSRTTINWTWVDPVDIDFSKVIVYLNGTFRSNVSKGKQYYVGYNLINNTEYEIATHTIDSNGNINQTWINRTTRTKK